MQSDILKKIDFVCLETLKGDFQNKQTFISRLTILLFPRTKDVTGPLERLCKMKMPLNGKCMYIR